MVFVKILNELYVFSGLIVIIFYFPQIIKVIRSKSELRDISLGMWGAWTVCLLISFLYGWYILKDMKFAFFSLVNSSCCFSIFGITTFKRFKYKNRKVILS
jgi:uncharacterized protein with PQ loop repeat